MGGAPTPQSAGTRATHPPCWAGSAQPCAFDIGIPVSGPSGAGPSALVPEWRAVGCEVVVVRGACVRAHACEAWAMPSTGDVRPRVPLGGYLIFTVTTSQIMDMWVEGGCYRPVATPDSGSVTTVTRRTADPALFPVAKGE